MVFFRADDVGAGGCAFQALCRLFRHHQVPLALAVVPAWLSDMRVDQLFRDAPLEEPLWGWHQHGWRHVNWERSGKKSEFGEGRPFEKQRQDLEHGRRKMEGIFGSRFLPVFTPPWNRLSKTTVEIAADLDFQGVSLMGPIPGGNNSGADLKNLRVFVDLHTRKSKNAESDYHRLVGEIEQALSQNEPVGIMIHHQRMTPFGFEFLDSLLEILTKVCKARYFGFDELLRRDDNG